MRRSMFWGLILLLIGGALLLENLGYLDFLGVSVWTLIWPLALIALGIWFLLSSRLQPDVAETETLVIPNEGETRAEVWLDYAAGELHIDGPTAAGELLNGTFGGGLRHSVQRDAGGTKIRLRSPNQIVGPWNWFTLTGRRWEIRLTDAVPLELIVKTGASEAYLNLEHLQVTRVSLESGANETTIIAPARAGMTEIHGSGGVTSTRIRIPEGVAARIDPRGGLSSVSVDTARFPRQGRLYISPDYETAEHKVDIRLEIGVGSVTIR